MGEIIEARAADSNETSQARSALAQLLEYRLQYGSPNDLLCLVADRELSLRRAPLLDGLDVAVLVVTEQGWRAVNDRGSALLGG